MLYNVIDVLLKVIFYVSLISITSFIINKLRGNRSSSLNSSIIKFSILALAVYFTSTVVVPNYAENNPSNLKKEGAILSTVNGYVFENAFGKLSFAISNDESTEWISASYGNIIQLEKVDKGYGYKKYGTFIKRYVVQVPQADWKSTVNKFGDEIKYSVKQ